MKAFFATGYCGKISKAVFCKAKLAPVGELLGPINWRAYWLNTKFLWCAPLTKNTAMFGRHQRNQLGGTQSQYPWRPRMDVDVTAIEYGLFFVASPCQ